MKIRFTLILLTVSVLSFGQTSVYHPFPDSNATWCCGGYGYDSGGNYGYNCGINGSCLREKTTFSMGNKDTLINGFLYHSVRCNYQGIQGCYPSCTGGFPIPSVDSYYYIRQDIASKKIWLYDDGTGIERTFYDFNLKIGDTLDSSKVVWAKNSWDPFIITSIDSILINGQYRTRYNYHGSCPGFFASDSSMVEGIGSLHGLNQPPSCFEYSYNLLEADQNGEVVYSISGNTTPSCFGISINVFEEGRPNIVVTISPNPFHFTTTLSLHKDFENAELTIYNALGVQVKQQKNISQTTTINRYGLTNGIYFFQLISKDGKLETGRLSIE